MNEIKRRERDAVLQSLQAGLVPKLGLHLIQVGRKNEVAAMLGDLERITPAHRNTSLRSRPDVVAIWRAACRRTIPFASRYAGLSESCKTARISSVIRASGVLKTG